MEVIINVDNNNNKLDSKIIRIQRNLIKMEFDIEMVNKILLYFQIESENQAIDYLTKNSEGLWGHPFIQKIKDDDNNNNNNNKIVNDSENNMHNNTSITFESMKSKINTIKNQGISNIIYYPMDEIADETNGLVCEICGDLEQFHVGSNNYQNSHPINNNKAEELIEDSKYENNNIIIHQASDSRENTDTKIIDSLNNENNGNNEINNDNLDINKNDSNNQNKECPICLCAVENEIKLQNCGHKFCQECFNNYLMELINKNNIDNIPCPIKSCFNKDIKEDFFNKYLTEEQYFKYRTFRSQNEIAKDPKKMFCPICNEYALIQEKSKYKYDPNDPRYIKSKLTCINGHEFCSCGIAIHEGECYRDGNDFQKFLINEHIKQCPKCGFYIKKLKGCNHMTCGNNSCKYEFCWLCMKEAVPGHFEYGQCKGMQFINPNSFMFKLKRDHPWIFNILVIFRSIALVLILLMILLFVPAVILILGLLFLIATRFSSLNKYLKIRNVKFFRLAYFIIGSLVIISLQNIAHLLIAFLIINFLLFIVITAIGRFVRMIYKIIRYLRS